MAVLLTRPPSIGTIIGLSVFLSIVFFLTSGLPGSSRHHYTPSNEISETRSVIGKMTMLYGDNPVYERALQSHEQHNLNFGYKSLVLRENMLGGFWSKPAYILSKILDELEKPIEERLEWLVWFDADLILLNPLIPLEIFLPPASTYPQINLLVTDDHRGLNNGVFFIRVTVWSVYLFTAVLGHQKSRCRPPQKLRTEDQGALELIITEPQFVNNTIHVPQRWFNAFPGWRDETLMKTTKARANSVKEGDLLVHFAGHKGTKAEVMEKWLDHRGKYEGMWRVPVEETGYAEEIRKFWEVDAPKEIQIMHRWYAGESAAVD